MKRTTANSALAFVVLSTVAARAAAENWPGWRGPARTGISAGQDVPLEWSATQGVAWRTPLPGAGISQPIVWDDRVVVTSSDGVRNEQLHVICLGRDDGAIRWRAKFWGTAPTLHHGTKSNMATPTPITDGQRIVAFFGTGDVFCLDMDGRLLWQRSLASEYGEFENRFAASSSPLLYDDAVILQCDHYGESYLVAIDLATGANRWKTDRPECWLSWSSPQLAPGSSGAAPELVVCGSEKLDAFDPRSGAQLWTMPGLARECIPTPVLGHGLVYVTSGPNGASYAIRPGARGKLGDDHVVWTNDTGTPFVPSAILVGDRYFMTDDRGVGIALDAHTGRTLWRKRLGGNMTASPVAAAGRLYFINEEGETLVLAAGSPRADELARNSLGEPVYASPAISQGRIFIRTARQLWCIQGEPGAGR